MRLFTLALLVILINIPVFTQEETPIISSEDSFVFLPGGHHIPPLESHVDEPRIGLFKSMDASGMRVEIGNSIDLFKFSNLIPAMNLTAGIDFFASAFVKNTEGLRLQIDAIDGFFGGNLSGSRPIGFGILEMRLRILHHSAHLVDGHWKNGGWIDNMEPIPFTKDYGELVIAHKFTQPNERIRYYVGTGYATLIRPAEIKRIEGLLGFEYVTNRFNGTLGDRPILPYIAYTMQLFGTPQYRATHFIQAGLKFGAWERKGINFYLGYYSGKHMFGEYFNRPLQTLGVGFSVDFE